MRRPREVRGCFLLSASFEANPRAAGFTLFPHLSWKRTVSREVSSKRPCSWASKRGVSGVMRGAKQARAHSVRRASSASRRAAAPPAKKPPAVSETHPCTREASSEMESSSSTKSELRSSSSASGGVPSSMASTSPICRTSLISHGRLPPTIEPASADEAGRPSRRSMSDPKCMLAPGVSSSRGLERVVAAAGAGTGTGTGTGPPPGEPSSRRFLVGESPASRRGRSNSRRGHRRHRRWSETSFRADVLGSFSTDPIRRASRHARAHFATSLDRAPTSLDRSKRRVFFPGVEETEPEKEFKTGTDAGFFSSSSRRLSDAPTRPSRDSNHDDASPSRRSGAIASFRSGRCGLCAERRFATPCFASEVPPWRFPDLGAGYRGSARVPAGSRWGARGGGKKRLEAPLLGYDAGAGATASPATARAVFRNEPAPPSWSGTAGNAGRTGTASAALRRDEALAVLELTRASGCVHMLASKCSSRRGVARAVRSVVAAAPPRRAALFESP